MKKSVKNTKKASVVKSTAKVNVSKLTPKDVLNRKQASEILKISIYGVDQALVKKQLKDLVMANVQKFAVQLKKSA